MPIFNKMAIFPLFKVLATGDLRVLYDRMNDVNNPIDMFTTKSAVKVGNIKEYDFYTDATQNEITEEFKRMIKEPILNLLYIDNRILATYLIRCLLKLMMLKSVCWLLRL